MTMQLRERLQAVRLTTKRSNLIAIAVTIVILTVFAGSIVHLAAVLNHQYETGQIALNVQLVEQNQSFAQLQREALRLMGHINMDMERLDTEAAQLQIDLLASRFFQLDAVANQPSTRPAQAEAARYYAGLQASVIGSAERWLASPNDVALRGTLLEQLTEMERTVNQDIINFGRIRVQAVTVYRDATQETQRAFAFSSITFAVLMMALVYTFYMYLRQAQQTEAALQTIAFKDQFLAVMSHELRTPLNAIIGFLGLMKMQGPNSTKVPHMIDRSRANAERLLSLIDDILDMSKIEAGKFEIHPEAVVFRDVVNRWQAQSEILALQKGLDFQCHVDAAIPQRLLVDSDAVSKVTTNLLSNALKFTEKGSVKLDIQRVGDQLHISVTDTGIGIAADKMDIIFESFRQVDGSIRRNFGGSGLGLSIVKQLTELMGGHVEVVSKEGSGSTFTITLPLVAAPVVEPDSVLTYATV